jgi:hypothetical protein
VQAVEPGGQVEHRAVAVAVDLDALAHQVPVLVGLAEHEDQAHHERQGEPPPQPVHVAPLGPEHAHLAGDGRQHEDRGERQRVRQVQHLVCSAHSSWPFTVARIEKYIANRAAKNMSSLESQMIVPTLTILGLVNE